MNEGDKIFHKFAILSEKQDEHPSVLQPQTPSGKRYSDRRDCHKRSEHVRETSLENQLAKNKARRSSATLTSLTATGQRLANMPLRMVIDVLSDTSRQSSQI